jgi:hypothetical protein
MRVLALALLALPSAAMAQALGFEMHWPHTGARMQIELRSSAETGAPTLDCPPELVSLAESCSATLPPSIVFDPGHSESNASNRSDLESAENPFEAPASPTASGPAAVYGKPELGDITRKSELSPGENQAARHSTPEMHEGKLNLATSLLKKYFLDRCFFSRRAQSSPVVLSHYPGEKNFGEYSRPDWVRETAPPEVLKLQAKAPVASELKHETLTSFTGKRVNSSLGGALITRIAHINYLLGSSRPWAFRLATQEEESAGKIPASAYSLSNLSPGILVSHHGDTSAALPPEDPGKKKLYQEKFASVRTAYLAHQNQPGKVRALRDEWFHFFKHELGLRSKDISAVYVPGSPMPESSPAESAYLSAPEKNPYFPSFAPAIRDALKNDYCEWQPLQKNGCNVIAGRLPSGLALLGAAVQTRNKALVEGLQLTGYGEDEMRRQIRKGDRGLKARITTPRERKAVDIPFSDGHILNARSQALGLMRGLCR